MRSGRIHRAIKTIVVFFIGTFNTMIVNEHRDDDGHVRRVNYEHFALNLPGNKLRARDYRIILSIHYKI